jgi:hypothetical protein
MKTVTPRALNGARRAVPVRPAQASHAARLVPAFLLSASLLACSSSTEPGGAGGYGASGSASTGGSSGAGASESAGGSTAAPSGACSMLLTFTTVNYGGRYAPANVSAVWVTDPQAAFVRTLEENGRIRQSHLGAWEKASGGSIVDAVSGATNRAPREHQVSWDCTDTSQAAVPPGAYTVSAEFTSDNTGGFFGGAAPLLQVQVDIGGGPQTLSPPDNQNFTGISLSYE